MLYTRLYIDLPDGTSRASFKKTIPFVQLTWTCIACNYDRQNASVLNSISIMIRTRFQIDRAIDVAVIYLPRLRSVRNAIHNLQYAIVVQLLM